MHTFISNATTAEGSRISRDVYSPVSYASFPRGDPRRSHREAHRPGGSYSSHQSAARDTRALREYYSRPRSISPPRISQNRRYDTHPPPRTVPHQVVLNDLPAKSKSAYHPPRNVNPVSMIYFMLLSYLPNIFLDSR